MLTKEGCLRRRERLWNAVPDDAQWLLVTDPRHVQYLANAWVNPISFSTCERMFLLLQRDSKATLLGENFTNRSLATEPYVDELVLQPWYDHKHSVQNRDHVLFESVKQTMASLSGVPGIAEAEWLPAALLNDLGTSCIRDDADFGTILRSLRRQKEADEVELLRRCMAACDAGHAAARRAVVAGASELDVYRQVQSEAVAAAGTPCVVYGDFRAVNAETPKAGGLPTSYVLRDGDLMIIDYSVVIAGYRSDFTNTIAVGEPTAGQRELFAACEAGMKAAEEKLAPGLLAREVYEAASAPIEALGHGKLGHHAGHGLGLGHPEAPILVPESDDTLVEGDVVTIEPGMYVPGIGGMRIEHNYLITADGRERLSNHVISL